MKNYTLFFMVSLITASFSFCAEKSTDVVDQLLQQEFTVKTADAMVTGFAAEGLCLSKEHVFVKIFAGKKMTSASVLQIINLPYALQWVSELSKEKEFKNMSDFRRALVKHVVPEHIFAALEEQGAIAGQTGFLRKMTSPSPMQ